MGEGGSGQIRSLWIGVFKSLPSRQDFVKLFHSEKPQQADLGFLYCETVLR